MILPTLAGLLSKARELARSRFARQSAWMTAGSLANLVSGFLFLWAFGRSAGPMVYGTLLLIQRIVEFVCTVLDLRIDEALTREIIRHRHASGPGRVLSVVLAGFAVDLLLGVLAFAVIAFGVAPWAAGFYWTDEMAPVLSREDMVWMIRLYAMGMFVATLNSSCVGILQAYGLFERMAAVFSVSAVLEALLPLVAWWIWKDLKAVIASLVVFQLLYNAPMAVIAWRQIRRECRGARPEAFGEVSRQLVRFGWLTTLSGALKMAFRTLDVLILGKLASPVHVGYYNVAKAYGGTIGFFAGPLGSVLLPKLSSYAVTGDWKRFHEVKGRLLRWMAAVTLPMGASAVLLAPWLIPLVMKKDFGPSVQAVLWIVMSSALTNLSCYLRPSIVAIGRLEISLWTNILTAATLVSMAWLLAPVSQHVGVAQAWFLAHLVGVGSGIWLMERAARGHPPAG